MNYIKTTAIALAITALTLTGRAAPSAGFVDFGKFTAPKSGEFVEVNIGKTLISMVARIVQTSETEAAEVLRGLERVRVNVIGLDDENRADMEERVAAIRTKLDSEGWDPIVTVKEKLQDVAIYLKTRGEEAVEGIVVTVLDGKKQAVLINVVGNIKPEKLSMIGEKLHIPPLQKALAGVKK
jgi:hypothetical protein